MSSTNTLINHIVRDRLKQIAPDEYAKCVALTKPMIANVCTFNVLYWFIWEFVAMPTTAMAK